MVVLYGNQLLPTLTLTTPLPPPKKKTYTLIMKKKQQTKKKHGDLCTMCSIIKSEMNENKINTVSEVIIFFKGSINYLSKFIPFIFNYWLIKII